MVIEIREVGQQDKAQWLRLWEGYTRFYDSPQPPDVTEYTWQRMLDPASPMLGRVALADGNVAGFAICVLHERIETVVNLIMFLSLLATAWDLSLVHHLSW